MQITFYVVDMKSQLTRAGRETMSSFEFVSIFQIKTTLYKNAEEKDNTTPLLPADNLTVLNLSGVQQLTEGTKELLLHEVYS